MQHVVKLDSFFRSFLSPIDYVTQSIEQWLSDWHQYFVNDSYSSYFSKDITTINYFDKRFWEGIFNEAIHELKERLPLDLGKAGLEERLIQLQGLLGKYTLSPLVYEKRLNELEKFISDLTSVKEFHQSIKKVHALFKAELQAQPEFFMECLQGDIIFAL